MAAITYNFGNLLSDFHKADSPAKRLEAVDGYGARRMQGLTRFIRDLNEGTLDDPEDFVMGFTLLEVLVTESNALSQAAIYSRYTDNAQDQKRFQDRVIGWQKTLWTQQKIAMDLIDQIPAETQENYRSDIRHFDARMKQLHKDHRKMPDYKKLADMAVTGVERGLWDLSVKHGQDALDAAYCGTEEAGADPAIGQKMAQLFTHRLRGIEGTLRRKGVQDYAEYFEKRSGIPAGITRALTEKPIATLQDRFPQEPNKVYSRRHGHKAIQSSIEAYAAFSPSFGQTLQRFYEDGGIIFNTARDNPSERGYAICAEDTFPYTRHTGNMTGVHIDAKYIGDDMELQRLMDHELSHALHVESLKAERALKHEFSFTKDSFLIELVAHVGEIIGLEHRISTMRNADHAMDLLTDYSTCKDLNIVSDAMSILAQQELIAALPEDGSAIPLRDIHAAHLKAALKVSPTQDIAKRLADCAYDASPFTYDMIDRISYLYADLGARAFAHKLIHASPEEREKMATGWEDMLKHSSKHNWRTALESVGIDPTAPDFLKTALGLSEEWLRKLGRENELNPRYYTVRSRGDHRTQIDAERSEKRVAGMGR